MAEAVLIATGDQSSERQAAKQVSYVPARAAYTVNRQGVDVWCRIIRAPIERYIPVAQIVGQNDDDVWMIWRRHLGRGLGNNTGSDEQQT